MTDEARCFGCNRTFNAIVAFERTHDSYQGCPHCDASLKDLFQQRSGEREADPDNVDIDYPFDGPGGVVS